MKKPKRDEKTPEQLVEWWNDQTAEFRLELLDAAEYSERLQIWKKWKEEQK